MACSTTKREDSYSVGTVLLNDVELVSLVVEGEERVCLAQLSNTLLKDYSYNEIHNRRVALGITCVQCSPLQLEVLRKTGAMPMSSRRCGMITRREAERLFNSFFSVTAKPELPDDFVFSVYHECGWGCTGFFYPSKYNSSRAKCIHCSQCGDVFSPNKFIFHFHETGGINVTYIHPDAANFNSWRRHIQLGAQRSKDMEYAWEDVKAMYNGGSRKRHSRSSDDPLDSELPAKLLSSVLPSSHSDTRPSGPLPICPILHSALPSGLRLPNQQRLHPLPTGFPAHFFRAAADAAAAALPDSSPLQSVWCQSQHLALNELMNRSRLLVPRLATPAFPPYPASQLSAGIGSRFSLLPGNSSLTTASPTASGSSAKSASTAGSQSSSGGRSSSSESKENKIRRPWVDSVKSECDGDEHTTAAEKLKATESEKTAAPKPSSDDGKEQNTLLHNTFLQQFGGSGSLML